MNYMQKNKSYKLLWKNKKIIIIMISVLRDTYGYGDIFYPIGHIHQEQKSEKRF